MSMKMSIREKTCLNEKKYLYENSNTFQILVDLFNIMVLFRRLSGWMESPARLLEGRISDLLRDLPCPLTDRMSMFLFGTSWTGTRWQDYLVMLGYNWKIRYKGTLKSSSFRYVFTMCGAQFQGVV